MRELSELTMDKTCRRHIVKLAIQYLLMAIPEAEEARGDTYCVLDEFAQLETFASEGMSVILATSVGKVAFILANQDLSALEMTVQEGRSFK